MQIILLGIAMILSGSGTGATIGLIISFFVNEIFCKESLQTDKSKSILGF